MTRSEELFEKSKQRIPGGVNSPVRAFQSVGGTPAFIKKAKGSHIFDVDGNEYIDYVCSWGPGILGHAYPSVIDAVKKACDNGLTFGAPTEKEYEIAELIAEMMPSMELVADGKFRNGGSNERDPCRKRLYAPRLYREVPRLLPRPLGRPSCESRFRGTSRRCRTAPEFRKDIQSTR